MARFYIMNDYLNQDSDNDSDSSDNDLLIHYSKKNQLQRVHPSNFSSMCRVCMTTNEADMTNIFDEHIDGLEIYMLIQELTHIVMSKDELFPNKICQNCITLLKCVLTFRDLCAKTDKAIRDAVVKKEENLEDTMEDIVKNAMNGSNNFSGSDDDLGNYDDSNLEYKDFDCETVFEKVKDVKIEIPIKQQPEEDNIRNPIVLTKQSSKKLFSCKYCMKIYKNSTVFNNHMIREHAQSMQSSNTNRNRKAPLPGKIHEVSACDICNLPFDNKNNLIVHMKVEHFSRNERVCCPKCPKTFDDHKLYMKHAQMHKNLETYLCEWCAKPFKSANNLKAHLRIHNNEFPFACSQCPYRARVKDALRSHMRTHTGERPYACDACPATFSCKSNLNGHIRRTHKQIKAYKCPVCSKEFSARQPMLDHKSCQHDGIKRYNCPVCGSHFGYKKGLRKHLINVHKKQKRTSLGKVPNYQIAQEKEMASQHLLTQEFF